MPILNHLPEDTLRTSDKALAWLLVLFGIVVSMGLAIDPAGWDDPVFHVVRQVPFRHFFWSATLAVATLIYAAGELIAVHSRRRGTIVIFGATLCAAWCLALTLAMTRMVYILPSRITLLWPLVMFFVSCLYLYRAIIYANAFTIIRWNTNPYQLWCTTFLMSSSLAQLIIGIVPSSVFTEIERPVAVQLALTNFMGGAVVMFGLHLRNKDIGLNLELSGAMSLVATVGWYCVEIARHNILAGTTMGFALDEAFLFGSFHRAVQIIALKYARWRGHPRMESRMTQALVPEIVVPTSEDRSDITRRHGR